jgi:signal transduction histidine kinase
MRILSGLLFLSLGLAFATGYLSLQMMQSEGPSFAFSNKEVSDVKRHFREKSPVVGEINVKDLFPAQADLELLDPRSVLSATSGTHFRQTAQIYKAAKSCQPDAIHDSEFSKAKMWIAFQCGQLSKLPSNFFEQPPFIFPLGQSYAALAVATEKEPFQRADWIQEHLSQFHALELGNIKQKVSDPQRELLISFGADELLSMVAGQSWILTSGYILAKRSGEISQVYSSKSLPAVDYLAYRRADWDQFLAQYNVETKSDTSLGCQYQDDGLCWSRSSQLQTKKIRWSFIGLFALAGILILFCIIQIIRSVKTQKLEDDRKKFALQTLTHELRTPLASLVVSSEQMMKKFSEMPSSMQENFLRIFDDVQRLTRVAETSRNYLGAKQAKSIVSFNFTSVPSVNDFISSVLERYQGEIQLKPLDSDISFTMDSYWVGVCIQNLVQNAIQHGKKPISVEISIDKNDLILSVIDCGSIQDKSKIFEAFHKRGGSPGLGLGLSIIETVVGSMGSQLKVSSTPTTFEFRIAGRT